MNDTTTFFLAFLAIFGGLAAYLGHLDRSARRLEQRVDALEAERASATAKPKGP